MRVAPEEYQRIALKAHALLKDVPLHDVWAIDLPACESRRTIVDLRSLLAKHSIVSASSAATILFALRMALGKVFGWDRESSAAHGESYLHRLSEDDKHSSLVTPGTREGPFRVLFVSPREAISEVRNVTVHGFSVYALLPQSSGYRLYWAIYVKPVGYVTSWYMRLIDPFRRFIIYPAVLRHIRAIWSSPQASDVG